MLNYLKLNPEAFGIDISDHSLKIAKLKKLKKGAELVSYISTKIDPGIIEGGEVKDEETLGGIIKDSLANIQGDRIKTKYVVASLPEEKSFLDIIRLPLMEEKEVRTAIQYELENHIPLPADEVYFDSKIINKGQKGSKTMEVLVVASIRSVVDSYIHSLKIAGLKPKILELECLATARALISREEKSKAPILIIDFGETRSSFIIFSNGSLRFTSTIPVSSQVLTDQIAKTLKISNQEAEKRKKEQGMTGDKDILSAIMPPLTDLVEQIKTHMNYYYSYEEKNKVKTKKAISKIILCGGGANLKGLVNYLISQLKLEVELGNPWVNILEQPMNDVPRLSLSDSLSYSTALGLALRGIEDENHI